jgi:hypothetical protein
LSNNQNVAEFKRKICGFQSIDQDRCERVTRLDQRNAGYSDEGNILRHDGALSGRLLANDASAGAWNGVAAIKLYGREFGRHERHSGVYNDLTLRDILDRCDCRFRSEPSVRKS